jgi:hypothetical protein
LGHVFVSSQKSGRYNSEIDFLEMELLVHWQRHNESSSVASRRHHAVVVVVVVASAALIATMPVPHPTSNKNLVLRLWLLLQLGVSFFFQFHISMRTHPPQRAESVPPQTNL